MPMYSPLVRPKLEMPSDFEASCELVQGVEDEFLAVLRLDIHLTFSSTHLVLREKMPSFLAELVPGGEASGLNTIQEGEEDEGRVDVGEEEDLSQASEANSQSQASASRSRSHSQAEHYEEDMEEEEDDRVEEWEDGDGGSQGSGKLLEVEEGDEDMLVPTAPQYQPCPEDDDFLAALDKVNNDDYDVNNDNDDNDDNDIMI